MMSDSAFHLFVETVSLLGVAGGLSLYRRAIAQLEGRPICDEFHEAYGRKLIAAGVEVVTTRTNATIHDFVMLNALVEAAPTCAAVTQAVDFLKCALAPTP